jgi:hypothetical protein
MRSGGLTVVRYNRVYMPAVIDFKFEPWTIDLSTLRQRSGEPTCRAGDRRCIGSFG